MVDVYPILREDWRRLQGIRLAALHEAPNAFLSTYHREEAYGEERWQAEFARGDWYIGVQNARSVGLLGVTREEEMPHDECYLEYLWVSPEWRLSGVASEMITNVLGRLRESGVRTIFLWVLEGNHPAQCLYKRLGFVSENIHQPLPADPRRGEELREEELMRLDLHSAAPSEPEPL